MQINLSLLDIVIFAVYILIVVVLGVYASRREIKTKRDYFLAGDKLPWWMIGGSIVASNISAHHLVAGMGLAYALGFVAMTTEWAAILIGLNVLLWIFLPYYLRNRFYTMPEYLLRRFGPISSSAFALLILLIYLFVEIAAVLFIGGKVLHALFDIPIAYSVWALAIATGIYTVIGGLRAVIWTEMFQLVVLLAGGLILSFLTVAAAGGPGALWARSNEWHLLLPASDPNFPWTMYLGGTVCISVFYFATNQFVVQRVLAAKNEWHARMGVVFTCYLKLLTPVIFVVPGLAAVILFENQGITLDDHDSVFTTLVTTLLPTGLVGLLLAGLVAAVMSHISGAVNSCATIATIDLYVPIRDWWRKRVAPRAVSTAENAIDKTKDSSEKSEKEDRTTVLFGRIIGALTILFGIYWALVFIGDSDRPIFLYIFDAYGYVTPGIATMFLMGVFWKRTTGAGALTAGILSIPLTLILDLYFPMPFQNRTGIAFWACMVVCALVSLITKPKKAEELEGLIWTTDSLRLPADAEQPKHWYGRPVVWWAIVTVIVLSFYVAFP